MKLSREEIARFIATLGIAMLISSGIRYLIQGEFLTFSKVLLIAGGLALVAALAIGYKGLIAYFSKRSAKQGSNTLARRPRDSRHRQRDRLSPPEAMGPHH
jgi:hypothetical protein